MSRMWVYLHHCENGNAYGGNEVDVVPEGEEIINGVFYKLFYFIFEEVQRKKKQKSNAN